MKNFITTTLIILLVIVGGYIAYDKIYNEREGNAGHESKSYDQLGFLIGPSAKEMKEARELGAGWVRPHPGPFVWGDMQKTAESKISFSETDDIVEDSKDYDIQLLVTIWPYAGWDQKERSDYDDCRVSGSEFVDEFGWYRCNPNNWDTYQEWVSAFVERYDGDGVEDMPGMQQAIKYWEVFNEPDLQQMAGESGLQFFVGDPDDYAELLKKTSQAIRSADPEAKILVAGAAGGDADMLEFYRGVFDDQSAINSFDIANVHCISSGDVESFNVEPYREMLDEFGIDKPIWVTEAEAFISSDPAVVATQTKESSLEAFELGAEKLFYTSRDFEHQPGGGMMKMDETDTMVDTSLDVSDPGSIFREICESNG